MSPYERSRMNDMNGGNLNNASWNVGVWDSHAFRNRKTVLLTRKLPGILNLDNGIKSVF